MQAEQTAMLANWPEIAGRRTLDLACGSGRYSRLLAEAGAREVFAVDTSLPMLVQVRQALPVRASMVQLPFADASIDVVVSGLALGHAANLDAWMTEVARVLRTEGTLLYSDFHPAAAQKSMTRGFVDVDGRPWTVPHHCHPLAEQRRATAAAGFTLEVFHEVRAGIELREAFPKSEEFYRRCHGLPLVLVARARKTAW